MFKLRGNVMALQPPAWLVPYPRTVWVDGHFVLRSKAHVLEQFGDGTDGEILKLQWAARYGKYPLYVDRALVYTGLKSLTQAA